MKARHSPTQFPCLLSAISRPLQKSSTEEALDLVPISRLTSKDQHRAETNQSETRSLNERKRLAEIKRGKPCKNDKRDDFLYALQLGGRVDRVADPIGRHRETIFNKGNTPAHQNGEHHGPSLELEIAVPRECHEDVGAREQQDGQDVGPKAEQAWNDGHGVSLFAV